METRGENVANKRLVILIFICLSLGFYADKIILGSAAIIRIHDTFDVEFPRYSVMGRLFLRDGFIGWYPYVAGGMPAYAWHTPPFYSLNLMSTVLPTWSLYGIAVIVLMISAGYGMYRFLFQYLGLSYVVSLIGGVFFAFITQIQPNAVVFAVFNYVFPLFFVWVLRVLKGSSLRTVIVEVIGINVIFLLAYITLALPMFYVLQVLIIILANFNFKEDSMGMLLWSTVIWTGFALMQAPALYQLFDFSDLAHRTYIDSPFASNAFAALVLSVGSIFRDVSTSTALFIPTIASISLVSYSIRVRRIVFITIMVLVIAAFFDSPLKTIFSGTIFIKMDLARFSWTLPFLFTILSFVGIQELFCMKILRFRYFLSAFAASFVLLFLSYPFNPLGALTFTVNIVTLVVLSFSYVYYFHVRDPVKIAKTLRLSCFFCLFFGGVVFVVGIRAIRMLGEGEIIPYAKYFDNHAGLKKLVTENDTSPVRAGAINFLPSAIQQYDIETADGRGPLFYKHYKDYFKLIVAPQLKTKKQNDHFDNYWYDLSLVNGDRSLNFNLPLLLAMNVKYLVSSREEGYLQSISSEIINVHPDREDPFGMYSRLVPANSVTKRLFPPSLYIYQLRNSFERGFLAKKAVVLPSDEKVLQALSTQTLQDLKDSVFFSAQGLNIPDFAIDIDSSKDFHTNQLKMTSYSSDKITFDTVLYTPAILVLTNNHDPKWTASVNGQETRIYRANHAFQAILFKQSGNYSVVFEYKNPLLWMLHGFIPLGVMLMNLIIFYGGGPLAVEN